MPTTEAFSRALIDAQLKDQGWSLTDGRSVRFEHALPDGKRADYLLCDRNGRGLAVIEAKRTSINAANAAEQALHYARLAQVPYVFLANGREIRFWDWQAEAHPRAVKTFFAQDDLERRIAVRTLRTDPLSVPIDRKVAGRDYQIDCIDTLRRVSQRRPEEQVALLLANLPNIVDALEQGGIVVFDEKRIRIRPLPIRGNRP